jgi:hypothetical protein
MNKSDEQLEALAEIPKTVKAGGKEFCVYPLCPGKISMLLKTLEKPIDSISALKDFSIDKIGNLDALCNEFMDEICKAFVIVTTQHQGKPIIVSNEDLEFARWAVDVHVLESTIAILIQDISFERLLKNVLSPWLKLNSAGGALSATLPISPGGPSTTSCGESASEV